MSEPKLDPNRPLELKEKLTFIIFTLFIPSYLLASKWKTFPYDPWFGFFVFLITFILCILISIPMLFRCPRLVRERMKKKLPGSSDSPEERKFGRRLIVGATTMVYTCTFDGWYHRDTFPPTLNYLGALIMVFGYFGIIRVFQTNQFAATTVYKQEGQVLVTNGVYSVVRHPMYFFGTAYVTGVSLVFGSLFGLIPVSGVGIFLYRRTAHEEKFLVEEFGEKYEIYQKKTVHKMIPFLL